MAASITPAQALRARHEPHRPLVLPNVWDAVSGRAFADVGFPALATASAAVSETLGYPDGEQTPAEEMFAAVARIVRAVEVPVTADIEAGYGLAGAELADRLLATGAAGCNLEDSDPRSRTLADVDEQAARIAKVRAQAGSELVINARVDVFLPGRDGPADQDAAVTEAIRRGRVYREAGADCVYPILAPNEALSSLVEGIRGPVNALFVPDGPTLAELGSFGIARITFGGGLLSRVRPELERIAGELADAAGWNGAR
jgi:2-methylisocitrate lyase-like PEP mutase family enzyme